MEMKFQLSGLQTCCVALSPGQGGPSALSAGESFCLLVLNFRQGQVYALPLHGRLGKVI